MGSWLSEGDSSGILVERRLWGDLIPDCGESTVLSAELSVFFSFETICSGFLGQAGISDVFLQTERISPGFCNVPMAVISIFES